MAESRQTLTTSRVLNWHKQVGAKSRRHVRPGDSDFIVDPSLGLALTWEDMTRADMHKKVGIDFSRVLHIGQSARNGAEMHLKDEVISRAQVVLKLEISWP